jgi:hypothetical protein
MRMSFRQFCAENFDLSASGFGANVRSSFWGLPSLNPQGLLAGQVPAGGYQSLSQIAQQGFNRMRFNDPTYIAQQTLQAMSTLCENLPGSIDYNKESLEKDPTYPARHYKYADYNTKEKIITGLTMSDLISGLYPRIKSEDVIRAKEMGIITDNLNPPRNYNPKDGELYDINVDVLAQKMEEMAKTLAEKEHGYQSANYLAGLGDRVMGATGTGGRVTPAANVNPMSV